MNLAREFNRRANWPDSRLIFGTDFSNIRRASPRLRALYARLDAGTGYVTPPAPPLAAKSTEESRFVLSFQGQRPADVTVHLAAASLPA
jgi:hypothetical protein